MKVSPTFHSLGVAAVAVTSATAVLASPVITPALAASVAGRAPWSPMWRCSTTSPW